MSTTTERSFVTSTRGCEISFSPRAPFSPPRQRQLDTDRVEQFRRWLVAELGLPAHALVTVAEWVSFDGRDAPHVTMVTVMTGAHQLAFSVSKQLHAIERADLPARLSRWPLGATSNEPGPARVEKLAGAPSGR